MKENSYAELDLNELLASLSNSADPLMFQYFKGLKNHELLITSDIDSTAIEMYVLPLKQWDADPEVEEIKIYVNTLGGSIFDGMQVAETIAKLKTKTTVEVLSYAYSMGGYIVVAGMSNPNVKVVCNEFSTFLIHAGSTTLVGDSSTVDDTMDFYRHFNNKMEDFMVEHTKLTKDKLKEMRRVEWFMTSDEMLDYGLVEEII